MLFSKIFPTSIVLFVKHVHLFFKLIWHSYVKAFVLVFVSLSWFRFVVVVVNRPWY